MIMWQLTWAYRIHFNPSLFPGVSLVARGRTGEESRHQFKVSLVIQLAAVLKFILIKRVIEGDSGWA